MQLSDVVEVTEANSIGGANQKIQEGWTLLAVTGIGAINGIPGYVCYVLGKKAKAKPMNISPGALEKANQKR
jgi:hypothetical protein